MATSVLARYPAADLPLSPALRLLPDELSELARHGYSEAEIFALVVPKRTLARRRARKEPLTVEESDKALRLKRIAVQELDWRLPLERARSRKCSIGLNTACSPERPSCGCGAYRISLIYPEKAGCVRQRAGIHEANGLYISPTIPHLH